MNINFKQTQFELFPPLATNTEKVAKRPYLFSSLTLSLENIIIFSIFVLLSVVFAFSFGVEKGKRVNSHKIAQEPEGQAIAASVNKAASAKPETKIILEPRKTTSLNSSVAKVAASASPTVNPVSAPSANLVIKTSNSKEQVNLAIPSKEVVNPELVKDGYTIQIASFKKQEYAQSEADSLKKKGFVNHEIHILTKGSYSIVCIGTFNQKQKADMLLGKLKKKYKDCLVRRF